MTENISAQQALEFVTGDREQIFKQLSELVGFNSVHGDPELQDQTEKAAAWAANALRELGAEVEEIAAVDGSTAVVGTRAGKEGAPTVLLYSHSDVVPAGDPAGWDSDPFTLTERDGRWYGRGAADCKGNVAMHLAALRAVEALGGTDLNLKFLIEGSEEQGGEGLSHLIETRPELFAADAIMIADAGNVKVGQPTLTTSLRGGGQIVVRVDTLSSPVHSGQFGGAAPDAVKALMRAIDSLSDDQGRLVIDGVDTRAKWEGREYSREDYRADAQLLDGVGILGDETDAVADFLWARPAVSVTGFTSTPVAEAVNAVPATAQANLNVRVPADMDPREVIDGIVSHLKAHTPWGAHVSCEVPEVNRGFTTDPTKPALATLGECLGAAYGAEVAQVGMGGSIPLTVELQEAHPNAEIALYGVEDPQAAIHSANESVDPTEIERIATAEALFLLRYGK